MNLLTPAFQVPVIPAAKAPAPSESASQNGAQSADSSKNAGSASNFAGTLSQVHNRPAKKSEPPKIARLRRAAGPCRQTAAPRRRRWPLPPVGQWCGNGGSNCSGYRRILGVAPLRTRRRSRGGRRRGRRGRRGKRTDAIRGDDPRGHGERERGRATPADGSATDELSGPGTATSGTAAQSSREPRRVGPFERDAEVSGRHIHRVAGVGGVERRFDRPFCQRACRRDGRRRSAIWRRHGPVGQDRHRRGCGGHGSRVGGNKSAETAAAASVATGRAAASGAPLRASAEGVRTGSAALGSGKYANADGAGSAGGAGGANGTAAPAPPKARRPSARRQLI